MFSIWWPDEYGGICCDNTFLLYMVTCHPVGQPELLPVISHGSLRIPNGSKRARAHVQMLFKPGFHFIYNVSWPKQASSPSQNQRAEGKTIPLFGGILNIIVQQHGCNKGGYLWPFYNVTEMATFKKLMSEFKYTLYMYFYLCMYFVTHTCTIIYTKHMLHEHILQGFIYLVFFFFFFKS